MNSRNCYKKVDKFWFFIKRVLILSRIVFVEQISNIPNYRNAKLKKEDLKTGGFENQIEIIILKA